jgi:AcrR family transcriptional regulator
MVFSSSLDVTTLQYWALPRTVDHERRQAIAERAADHLLEHGLVAVSLRDLAAAVAVSPRMLIHHFGSREELVACALRAARSRQRAAFEARLAAQGGRPYVEVLTDAWRWFTTEEARPYLRLFGQVHALAGVPDSPHAEFLRESVLDWLPTIARGFAADGIDPATARELTTLTLAVIRGLLQDANATADHQRVSAGFDRYASLLQSACAPHETTFRSR